MTLYERTMRGLEAQNDLGAREITSFDGYAANDNGADGTPMRGPRRSASRWALPAIAFTGGLTAALIVSGLSDWLNFNG